MVKILAWLLNRNISCCSIESSTVFVRIQCGKLDPITNFALFTEMLIQTSNTFVLKFVANDRKLFWKLWKKFHGKTNIVQLFKIKGPDNFFGDFPNNFNH